MAIARHRLVSVAAGSVGVVLVLVVLGGLVWGPRLLTRPQQAPVSTSKVAPPNPALKGYRDIVNRDGAAIPTLATPQTCDVGSDAARASGFSQCRAGSLTVKAAAQKYVADLSTATVPEQLKQQDESLKTSLQALIAVQDERVAAIDSKSVDGIAAANLKAGQVYFNGVSEAEAEIRCWPAKVGPPGDFGSAHPCVRS